MELQSVADACTGRLAIPTLGGGDIRGSGQMLLHRGQRYDASSAAKALNGWQHEFSRRYLPQTAE
jgi:hypothetical protein